MTASVLGDIPRSPDPGAAPPPVRPRAVRRGRLFGIRAGQLVVTQVAAVAVLAGAVYGTVTLAAGVALAIVLLALAWLRMRGRWAFEWLAVGLRFAGRRHDTPVNVASNALLEFGRTGRAGDAGRVGRRHGCGDHGQSGVHRRARAR